MGDNNVGIYICGIKDENINKVFDVSIDKIGLTGWTNANLSIMKLNNLIDLTLKNVGTQNCLKLTAMPSSQLKSIPNDKYTINIELEDQINTLYIYDEY